MPRRTRVKSRAALAAAFNAEPLPTGLPGRQRRAIDRTALPCDKNDARRTGRSEPFRCGARVIRTRAAVGGFWPPSRRASYPTCPKTSPAPEWCKAASVSRQIASHWRKPTVTKARPRHLPGARTRATRVRSSPGPCARTRDEIESPVSSLASHRKDGLAQRRCHQLPALGAHQSCRLSELTNDMQRQEVWFVDHLVESERVGLIVVRPFNELAHLGHHSP